MITEVGEHRVQHGDVMGGLDKLMGSDMADLVYSDPPWGQGNLRYWKTINRRMTGDCSQDVDFDAFINRFFGLLKTYAKDKVVLEYGCKWSNVISDAAVNSGFRYAGKIVVYYRAGSVMRPCDIHFMSKHTNIDVSGALEKSCEGLEDLKLVEFIFDHVGVQRGEMCLDPMCGMGFTAQAAKNRGMIFRGNELNSKRLSKTIDRLKR